MFKEVDYLDIRDDSIPSKVWCVMYKYKNLYPLVIAWSEYEHLANIYFRATEREVNKFGHVSYFLQRKE